jgi:hypothetical protein
MSRFKKGLAVLLAALTPLLAGLGAAAIPAQANHYSWVHNQRGSAVCLSWYQGYNGYCRTRMPNGTKFAMRCWADHRGYNGNYDSARWFYGQAFNTGSWGWVHASYVYYQKRVPHC